MEKAEKQGITYNPWDESEENVTKLQKIVDLGKEFRENTNDHEMLKDFARCFGIDFCPVYSVLGSIISQEIIKVVESISFIDNLDKF